MRSCFIMAAAVAAWSAAASAGVIAQYSSGFQGPTVAANATATDIAQAPKVNNNNVVTLLKVSNSYYVSQPFFTASRDAVNESNTAANVYFTFTVSASQGYELDLSSISLNANRGGATAPRTLDIRSGVDNYQTSLTGALPVEITTQRPASTAATGTTWTTLSSSLGSSAYQNLPNVTFRVYFMTPGSGQNIDIDDVVLSGTVSPVPEPTVASAVIGLGSILLTARRPRHSR